MLHICYVITFVIYLLLLAGHSIKGALFIVLVKMETQMPQKSFLRLGQMFTFATR